MSRRRESTEPTSRALEIEDAAQMPIGSVRLIAATGVGAFALYRLEDGYYATDDLCTHGDGSLAEGDVDGDEIVCPFHLGRFDIRTGEATMAPCVQALRCHAVTVSADGRVYLELPDGNAPP